MTPVSQPGIDTMTDTFPSDNGDSADLEALFDSIAAGASATPTAPAAAAADADSGDSAELQALFDSLRQEPGQTSDPQEAVFNRIGLLARQLHDSLRGLGMDKLLEDSARQIPDARQRLAYIAQMTEQAASRVLNATDIARPVQEELIARSQALALRWEKLFANQLSVDEFKSLATDTRGYFAQAPASLKLTNDQLLEIMMAQDFQDLTGQVIKKIVELVQGLETQLLGVLLEAMPEQRRAEAPAGLLNGPVVATEGRRDIVTSQSQVDQLLESLGF